MNEEAPPPPDRLMFEQIHRQHHATIYDLILRLVGDRDAAEDLTVETFMQVYRCWHEPRTSTVALWLHEIAFDQVWSRQLKNRLWQLDASIAEARQIEEQHGVDVSDIIQGLSEDRDRLARSLSLGRFSEEDAERDLAELERRLGIDPDRLPEDPPAGSGVGAFLKPVPPARPAGDAKPLPPIDEDEKEN